MVTPNDEAQETNAQDGPDHGLVSKDWLPCIGGDDFRADAQCRQQYDVHLGVAQEPEQVLVQNGEPPVTSNASPPMKMSTK